MIATVIRRVNSRLEANTSSIKLAPLEIGTNLNIVGLKYGEEYRGNKLWYVDDKNIHFTSLALSLNLQNNALNNLIDLPSLWDIAKNKVLKIGIFDSGVTKENNLLKERVIQLNHENSDIIEHHADYMATIIAGGDLENGYVGFLPNALIYSYQAAKNDAGEAEITANDFLNGLQMFVANEVDIINVSMCTNDIDLIDFFQTSNELSNMLNTIKNKNIIITAAAGNQPHTKSDDQVYYPAALDDVISVTGYELINNSADFDNSWNLWTGIKVISPSFQIYDQQFYADYNISDTIGTSISSAVTAGIIGIFKNYYLKLSSDSISFRDFVLQQISIMPEIKTPEKYKDSIKAVSFKYLDFQKLKTILKL